MPVNTDIRIPFIPQEGITSQILSAIQLANEHHHQTMQEQLGQQQANTQQAAQQSQAGLQGAQTQQIQAGLSAGLPQAEADYKTAVAQHEKLASQYEEEMHPLNKAMLETQLQNAQADIKKKETLLKLMTMTQGPQMFDQQVDSVVPLDKYPELNQRTKVLAHNALQIGDLEGARKVIDKASDDISAIEKETNPKVIQAHATQAAQTAIAVERAH